MDNKFDDIAPLYDHEVEPAIQDLLVDPGFHHAVTYVMPDIDWTEFSAQMSSFKTKREFQAKMIYPVVSWIGKKSSTGLHSDGWENLKDNKEHVILSNHRDIVLDAGLLNIMRFEQDLDTTEIAIGDNLLIHPWIDKLVRLNKSFIVKRGVSIREQLLSSKHLSEYIYHNINEKDESVWIAQREGRAKDSDDRTQESLLKMLTLHNHNGNFVDNLKSLNMVPLTITYEFDPCDYLKAKEFQQKRDDANFKKTQRDDLLNMEIGILGQKGQIVFRFGKCINEELENIRTLDKREQVAAAAKIIDEEIHRNYAIFKGNYIAYDSLYEGNKFSDRYTDEDKKSFMDYLNAQIDKIDLDSLDRDFLIGRMLVMYSNTLKNHLAVTEGCEK